jgi:T5orf172 domain
MGSSVHQARSGKRQPLAQTKRPLKSPLDRAGGWELVWNQVTPVFEAARDVLDACFVYVIGEEDGGPFKIGSAIDPVKRLRDLQVGNPRRLRVEYVLLGDEQMERLLHQVWEEFAIRSHRGKKVDALPGTEWFRAEARSQLEPIFQSAADQQVKFMQAIEGVFTTDDLIGSVLEAHSERGFVLRGRDEVSLLAAGAGQIIHRRSRL